MPEDDNYSGATSQPMFVSGRFDDPVQEVCNEQLAWALMTILVNHLEAITPGVYLAGSKSGWSQIRN